MAGWISVNIVGVVSTPPRLDSSKKATRIEGSVGVELMLYSPRDCNNTRIGSIRYWTAPRWIRVLQDDKTAGAFCQLFSQNIYPIGDSMCPCVEARSHDAYGLSDKSTLQGENAFAEPYNINRKHRGLDDEGIVVCEKLFTSLPGHRR